MVLLAIGINHKTAPIALREQAIFSPNKLDDALNSLLAQTMVQGVVILSTCNRTELYLSVKEQKNMKEHLVRWLCKYHNLRKDEVYQSFYWHYDNAAVKHLMRVASGLDSLVFGESQILGQVKKAFADSRCSYSLSSELERMFQKTFYVAKKIRTETKIGTSAISVAFVACNLARKIFKSFSTIKILLIGAGETIELAARYLRKNGVKKLIIANRTPERAQLLAQKIGAEAIGLKEIDKYLVEVDVIISSTASSIPIIYYSMVERALKIRRNKPMLLVDIAVPRDVEPEVSRLTNAYLYSVDDLQSIIENNIAQRKSAAVLAETIITQESNNFMIWLRAQKVVNTICKYRNQANQIRTELEIKALTALQQGTNAEDVLRDLSHKLTNRLIHAPTKSLQEAARDGDTVKLQILRDSLGLD